MSSLNLRLLAALTAMPILAVPALAAAPPEPALAQANTVHVANAWARASAGAATTGAAYVALTAGPHADQLVGASTPVAGMAEVHETRTDNGVMKMRPVPDLPLPAGQPVTFAPGGMHIMLMGLKHPLVAGQSFPLTLMFAHSPPVTTDVKVQPLGRAAAMGDHESMKMH